MTDYSSLEKRLGYHFSAVSHLECALTHRSAHRLHNERLEFLGDSILNFIISGIIYNQFADASEGQLSRLRASLVKGETLSKIAQEIGLGDYLKLGSGELKSGGYRRPSILADTFEAIIGAIYLDGGIEAAKEFITRSFQTSLNECNLETNLKDPKTQLQEILQGQGMALPEYEVVHTYGQTHNQTFEVVCHIPILNSPVSGKGSSRRKAEQDAAQKALAFIKAQVST